MQRIIENGSGFREGNPVPLEIARSFGRMPLKSLCQSRFLLNPVAQVKTT